MEITVTFCIFHNEIVAHIVDNSFIRKWGILRKDDDTLY